MRSGVRIPFHLEVAETQRVAQKEEQRLLLEKEQQQELLSSGSGEATTTQKMDISSSSSSEQKEEELIIKQEEKSHEKTQTQFSTNTNSDNNSYEINMKKVVDQQQDSLVAEDDQQQQQDQTTTSLFVSPAAESSVEFIQTPADPPTLSDFETLKNMTVVPRYDAFYEAPLVPLRPFRFQKRRWRYLSFWKDNTISMDAFLSVDEHQAISVAHVYRHQASGISVTLLPITHVAHPSFWVNADELCCQHHSVLMEGRYSPTSSDISVVPPRNKFEENRPEEELDAEGWEPRADSAMTNFRQPYSWGVRESPYHTIIHAADTYDYDRLPLWARLRHNVPFFGNYVREKRCLNILHQLSGNGYESFVIPWGVAHMPIFSKILLQNDFKLSGTTRVTMFNRIDGPTSAAYIRKLRSSVSWASRINLIYKCTVSLAVVYSFGAYLGLSYRDILDYDDLANMGLDNKRRRAWDSVMQPSKSQHSLRWGDSGGGDGSATTGPDVMSALGGPPVGGGGSLGI